MSGMSMLMGGNGTMLISGRLMWMSGMKMLGISTRTSGVMAISGRTLIAGRGSGAGVCARPAGAIRQAQMRALISLRVMALSSSLSIYWQAVVGVVSLVRRTGWLNE